MTTAIFWGYDHCNGNYCSFHFAYGKMKTQNPYYDCYCDLPMITHPLGNRNNGDNDMSEDHGDV